MNTSIAELIREASDRLEPIAGEDARLEVEVLLGDVLGIDRSHVIARLKDAVEPGDRKAFERLIERRMTHEPLAYIRGHREFYGINIVCRPGALIPRPETEMLVDLAREEIDERGDALRIADVGCGSGAIAVAIAVHTRAHVVAIDASDEALAIAYENLEQRALADRVTLRHGDLLEGTGEFDVIVANLPYVAESEYETLDPEIRSWEPPDALVGGATGTEAIARLLSQAPAHLADGGVLGAEIGATQAKELITIARGFFPEADVYVMKDLAGLDRMLVVRRGRG